MGTLATLNEILHCYNEVVEVIKNDKNTLAIFLVGSSKNIENMKVKNINDIDIFVICNQESNQIRYIKKIKNIEFDINKFSIDYTKHMIENGEYFFINEMKDAKVIYDKSNLSSELINSSIIKYNEGPKKISEEEIDIMANILYGNISSLEEKDSFENYEYEFLTNTYLKDIIKGYFIKNRKWILKDKKIFKYLRENEKDLFKLATKVYEKHDYRDLKNVYEYVFSNK
ncbi:hypothetical protein [Paraclostridium sordellii]|uniref:hypothetical protein n=1 Tax=Paraclostridium sordellii TaxID=1505 RepID=UPI0003862D05|nr:hypothetical protein [Paeniclostridium sordellii]EPZ57605.1 hypothetical protein H476_1088 [[Clostridium] sordellii VPI 9048] [Paeniclostridium sordellii VPI 9048]CEK37831.1 conserved hypothetical protein [[Clostridium] sordellii] [Paeniclostridium sordellii]